MAYFIKVSYTEALTLLAKHRASLSVVGLTGHWMIYIVCPWLCPLVTQVNTNKKHILVYYLTIYAGWKYYKVLGSTLGDSLREWTDTFFCSWPHISIKPIIKSRSLAVWYIDATVEHQKLYLGLCASTPHYTPCIMRVCRH